MGCWWNGSDARPSYFNLLYLGTRQRMFENIGPGHGLASRTAGATSRCMQSGSMPPDRVRAHKMKPGNSGAATEVLSIFVTAEWYRYARLDAGSAPTSTCYASGHRLRRCAIIESS